MCVCVCVIVCVCMRVQREIAFMLVECCSQERSYMRFYGMLGQRLCLLNQAWVAVFNDAFHQQYTTVHRLETNKLRNVAKFFSQLFFMDALPWTSMACIQLNEEDTNSSRYACLQQSEAHDIYCLPGHC